VRDEQRAELERRELLELRLGGALHEEAEQHEHALVQLGRLRAAQAREQRGHEVHEGVARVLGALTGRERRLRGVVRAIIAVERLTQQGLRLLGTQVQVDDAGVGAMGQQALTTSSWPRLPAICRAVPAAPTKLTCAPREMRNWMSATLAPLEAARLSGELPSESVQLTSAPSRTTICTRLRSLLGMAVLVRKLLRMKAGATRCRRSVLRPMPLPKGMSSAASSFAACASSSFHTTR